MWGPETPLRVDAGNDGAQGGASTATIVTSYSDWHGAPVENLGSNGAGGVTSGAGRLDVAAQASAAWEAAVCWGDDYAVRRLAEVRAV